MRTINRYGLYTAVALALLLMLAPLCTRAQDGPQEPPVPTPEEFFAAKAAAGGWLEGELLEQAKALIKQNLHEYVQLNIERFGLDHPADAPPDSRNPTISLYPQHVNQLLKLRDDWDGYVEPGFYANPVTASSASERNAQEVPFGWSELAPGNFTYLQRYDALGRVTGYAVLGYGPQRAGTMDVDGDGQPDGVIIMFASGNEPFPPKAVYFSGGHPVMLQFGQS